METFIQWLPAFGAAMFLSTIGYIVYSITHHSDSKKKKKNTRHVAHSTSN